MPPFFMDKIDTNVSSSGLVTRTYTDELTGKLVVVNEQDIQANVEMATRMRNDPEYSADGIKKGMWHAAHIPDVTIVELMGIGVNVFTASAKEIVAGLKRLHKDHLLTTTKRIA